MKLTLLILAGLLGTGATKKTPQPDFEGPVITITSHEEHSFSELVDVIEVAQKRNLRGSVDINELTNCDLDVTPDAAEPKHKKLREMPKKTVTFLYSYTPKD